MCRIVGIAGCNSNQLPIMEQRIIRMRDAMTHGGPDDAGIYTDKEFNVVLGHRSSPPSRGPMYCLFPSHLAIILGV